MSARREKRLRQLERRVECLEIIAHHPIFGIDLAHGSVDADFKAASDPPPKRGLFRRIKELFG